MEHGDLEFSSREEAENSLKNAIHPFYVYALGWPNGAPFYVGKGTRTSANVARIFQHEAEARLTSRRTHKLNVIRKVLRGGSSLRYAICRVFEDEGMALALERTLIQRIGRHDLRTGPLTNQTDGGEGQSNPSQESRDRRVATLGGDASDPERRKINEFFHGIDGDQPSVPVKPLSTWKRAEPLIASVKSIGPTPRMARAVVASAVANGLQLEAGIAVPRLIVVDDVEYLIENGCGREMIAAGIVEPPLRGLEPRSETMRLTTDGLRVRFESHPQRALRRRSSMTDAA